MVYGDNYFQSVALSEVLVTPCSHCHKDTEGNAKNAQGIGLLGLMGAVVININIINSGPRVDYSDSHLMGQIYF